MPDLNLSGINMLADPFCEKTSLPRESNTLKLKLLDLFGPSTHPFKLVLTIKFESA